MALEIVWRTVDGLRALDLAAAGVRCTLLPDAGGKFISLRAEPDWIDRLWRMPGRSFGAHPLDTPFADADLSGWDECFPNIGAGTYPAVPWAGTMLADHGELWTAPWECDIATDSVTLRTYGVRFPYCFEKVIEPIGMGRWRLHYTLTNLTAHPFHYVWASHPLFVARPGTRILLPNPGPVAMAISQGGTFGPFLAEYPWPYATTTGGQSIDLSVVTETPRADKFFTRLGAVDWCMLHEPSSGAYVGFAFDPAEVTHVGIWHNSGAWPAHEPAFHVALEPGRGRPDWLDTALVSNEAATLAAKGVHRWSTVLALGHATNVSGFARDGTCLSGET